MNFTSLNSKAQTKQIIALKHSIILTLVNDKGLYHEIINYYDEFEKADAMDFSLDFVTFEFKYEYFAKYVEIFGIHLNLGATDYTQLEDDLLRGTSIINDKFYYSFETIFFQAIRYYMALIKGLETGLDYANFKKATYSMKPNNRTIQ